MLQDPESMSAPDVLERQADEAYLLGRDEDFLTTLERCYAELSDAGDDVRAARCACRLAFHLSLRGDEGHASGWLGRARRLIADRDCVEQGYVLLPLAEQQLEGSDTSAAFATAEQAAAVGDRFAEPDLSAAARHVQGRALLRDARIPAGIALLDEVMLAVTAGELSPIFTGLIYCSVIDACGEAYAVDRAREWTAALADWCARRPDMVAFSRTCLVQRAEILRLHGAWPAALSEAERACAPFPPGSKRRPPANAYYQQGEVHRLRGELDAAEAAYRESSRRGRDPQPGLALLRLAQGRTDPACAALRRALDATSEPLPRSRLLPAAVDVLLANGSVDEADAAARELDDIAQRFDAAVLRALATQARGAIDLARGDARTALGALRDAAALWTDIEVPYEAARARALLGLACRALGDEDGAGLELDAARAAFAELGAAPDLDRVQLLLRSRQRQVPTDHPLSPRELEVLRLVATGRTNRAVADELFISVKTVERHLGNIFGKLGVSSRAAATAWAVRSHLA